MISNILKLNWIGLMLVIVTLVFMIQDRAFAKKIRIKFEIAAILALFTTLLADILTLTMDKAEVREEFVQLTFSQSLAGTGSVLIKIVIFALLVYIFLKIKNSKIDYIFSTSLLVLFIASMFIEVVSRQFNCANGVLCVIVSLFYYYFVMQNYKKDGLTRLFLRHDLYYEMEDLHNKDYDVVLVDVDNFKLINDKYGHDRGDEVLFTIADTIKKNLPKHCRAYRFGGDEFVVVSRNNDRELLEKIFEKINSELWEDELRISVGIAHHNAGEWGKDAISVADERMYENKKLLKSEDIWDDMTGLFNYKGFLEELDSFRNSVGKDGHFFSLVTMDIDRLNNINMAYGYTEGNLAIKVLSRVIKSSLKGREFIGHLGSDEFAVAIECENEEDSRVIDFINEISEGIGSAYELANKDYTLKINIGRLYAGYSDDLSVEELVNNALYIKSVDKDDRRKTGLADDNEYDNQEEAQVVDIIENNKFKYVFQPIVSAKDGEIVAYESLMRSDTEKMISPLKILKYAERNKLLYQIEKHTFFNVLSHINDTKCIAEGRSIFINSIPGFALTDLDYELLKSKYGELLKNAVIEITEQREIDDETFSVINARRDKDGYNLAIDDYGSGCSNTNSLLRYMPQVVKLDRLLITGIDRNAKKQFFVNSIISFARENDMLILAEGVETESELKTVIRLGVDMIQGFFTAKPAYEVIDEIDGEIKKIIIDENLKVSGNQRMVYTASSDVDLSVVHLAMEDYTKINVATGVVGLVGNPEYTADMVIRVKENTDTILYLNNVNLNAVDDEPCIDIGENSNVTIALEGNNKLNAKGIHVPESSSLTIKGTGNLSISAKGHQCYAIGADAESAFGNIMIRSSGDLNIFVDGENCVGIGGGVVGSNSEIHLALGSRRVNVAAIDAVGIGCYKGNVPITIKECSFTSDFRVNRGVVIGAFEGDADITIQNYSIEIEGSGTQVCGIGSIGKVDGKVLMSSGSYKIKLNGQKLYLLGCNEGALDIIFEHTKIDMMGEGDSVIGFGSYDNKSSFNSSECFLGLVINASSPTAFGVNTETSNLVVRHSEIKINGSDVKY